MSDRHSATRKPPASDVGPVSRAASPAFRHDSPEARLLKANRTLTVLSDINQAIVREREPAVLFETACRIAVERGGFPVAWIGVVDAGARRIDCVAQVGEEGCRLGRLDVALDEYEGVCDPAVVAVNTREHVVVSDIARDTHAAPWRDEALRLGLHAAAALPLVVGGEARGAVSLYSDEAGFFDDEAEIELLDEMATDISFAMESALQDEQRQRAQDALARTSELLERASELAKVGGWELDLRTMVLTWSAETYRIHEVDPAVAPSVAAAQDFYGPELKPGLEAMVGAAIEHGTPWDYELPMTTAKGRSIWVRGHGSAVMEDGTAVLLRGTFQDITERKEAEEAAGRNAARLEVLADASQAFAAVDQDYQRVLDRVVRKVAEALGDGCWVRMLSDDGKWLDVAALYVADPEAQEPVHTLLTQQRQSVDDPGLVPGVLRSGQPAFVPVITREQMRAMHAPSLWPLFERFAIHSVIAAPLLVQGRNIGVLGVTRYRSEQPPFTEEDMGLALDLAGRAALAISSALLLARVHDELVQRVQAEDGLRESEGRLHRALAAAESGIWEVDLRTGETVWSDELWSLYDLDRRKDEPGREAWLRSVHPEDRDSVAAAAEAAISAGAEINAEWRVNTRDGSLRWVVARGFPDRDAEGRTVRYLGIVMDITQVKQSEQALLESDQRFRLALRNAPVSVAAQDRGLRYIWAYNQRTARPEEIIGKSDADIFTAEEAARITALKQRVLEEGIELHEQMWLDRPGGRVFLAVNFEPIRDLAGLTIGVVSATVDLTGIKLAEEAARASRVKLETALTSMTDAVFISDTQGNFVDFNEAFATFHRFGSKDECARSLAEYPDLIDVFMDDGRPAPLEDWAVPRALRGETATDAEYSLRRKDTGESWVGSYSFAPICDENGAVTGSVVVGRDITDRKEADRALRESERRLRRFYEAGLIGVFYWTSAGEIVEANDRYLEMTGFTREELEAGEIDWVSMTPPEYRTLDAQSADELRATGVTAVPYEKEYVRKDGSRMSVLVAGAALDDEAQNGVAFVLDITDRKRAENKVARQAEQLRRTVEGTVLAMSRIVESRDPYTAGHERRVAELATAIGAGMGMEGEDLSVLHLAGLIHDLGKIAVPAEILTKPGRLSEVEFRLIQQHPATGFDIIADIDFGRPVAGMVLQHHERLDGTGYPMGLRGEEILPEARILAVADVVEAMSSHRPYRAALGIGAALDEIRENAGVKYVPDVVDVCVRLVEEQGFRFTS